MGGREPVLVHPAFCQYGAAGEAGAVLVTVPHAGREYPADIVRRSRVGLAGLRALEDRHVDALAAQAVAAGHCVLVARRGRAIIDLNRHEAEFDSASVADVPHGVAMRSSAKLRGGLGLVPHRYHSLGDLWLARPAYAEVRGRIEATHRPYHDHVAALITQTRAVHGRAVLIDLHSMPSIRQQAAHAGVDVVLGDRHGQSASPDLIALAAEIVAAAGYRAAINTPYAGGHTLERHARPERGVQAIQVEIDRALYLDGALEAPGAGVARCGAMVAALAEALGRGEAMPLAAE